MIPGLPKRGTLPFQVGAFLAVGGVQLALDTLVFIALSALGVPVVAANVAGRVIGASVGYWLNGRVTFAREDGPGLHGRALQRFVVSWVLLTTLGTVLLRAIDLRYGLGATWLAKPLVEAFLALLGFVSLKYFVFRPRAR